MAIKKLSFYQIWYGNVSFKLILFVGLVLLISAYTAKQLYFT